MTIPSFLGINPQSLQAALQGVSAGLLAYGGGRKDAGLIGLNATLDAKQQQFLNSIRDKQDKRLDTADAQDAADRAAKLARRQAAADQVKAIVAQGKLNPQQTAIIYGLEPEDALNVLGKQAFAEEDKPKPRQIGETRDYLKGNQKVTEQWDGMAWVPLGAGPAYAPQQDNSAFGMMPIYGIGPDGKPVIMQLGKNGSLNIPQIPQGYSVAPQTTSVDTGTGTQLIDKRTGQPVVPEIAKDVRGVAQAQAVGKLTGEAQINLPAVEENANVIKSTIAKVRAAPGRATGTGLSATLDPRNYIAGTDAANFKALREQLVGQDFLQAYNNLRGGGQITEIEGEKAQNALARLQTAQSDEAFLTALDDFEKQVDVLTDIARRKAAGGAANPPASAPTDSGGVEVWKRDPKTGKLVPP